MPSRKKAKGKARKAAKEAKAKEEENRVRAVVEVADNQRQEESLEQQMERLVIYDSKQLCWHGRPPLSPDEAEVYKEFIIAYLDAFYFLR